MLSANFFIQGSNVFARSNVTWNSNIGPGLSSYQISVSNHPRSPEEDLCTPPVISIFQLERSIALLPLSGTCSTICVEKCPPCFNCLLPVFTCGQFGNCNEYDGQCKCPPGWGGIDCLTPRAFSLFLTLPKLIFNLLECDSLADGDQRSLRGDEPCECKEGWGGINCNGTATYSLLLPYLRLTLSISSVCKTDAACVGFPLPGAIHGGLDDDTVANMTCYNGGETVFSNHQMCDITSMFCHLFPSLAHSCVRPQDPGHASGPTSPSDFQL